MLSLSVGTNFCSPNMGRCCRFTVFKGWWIQLSQTEFALVYCFVKVIHRDCNFLWVRLNLLFNLSFRKLILVALDLALNLLFLIKIHPEHLIKFLNWINVNFLAFSHVLQHFLKINDFLDVLDLKLLSFWNQVFVRT